MAADREETIQAPSRAELAQLLARHRWLKPVSAPRRVPGGTDWFVRVRGRVSTLAPAPRPRPRGRTITAIAAAAVVVLAVAAVALVLAVRWVAGHWALVVVLGALTGLAYAKLRRTR